MAERDNLRTRNLLTTLRNDKDVDRRIIEVLEAFDRRFDEVNGKVESIVLPKTELIPVQYNAADFVGVAPLTWAVTNPQLKSFTFSIQDDMMEVSFRILDSTLGGGVGPQLRVNVPANQAIAGNPTRTDQWQGTGDITDAGGAAVAAVLLAEAAAPSVIQVYKLGGGNFVLGVAPIIRGQIRFGIGNALFKNF